MRGLTAFFLFLGDVEKTLGFLNASLGIGEPALGADDGVIILNHRCVQASRGHLDASLAMASAARRAIHFAVPRERKKLFVDDGLFVIDVHAVVGDEDAGGSPVALGVDVLIERAHLREARGAGLRGVFAGLKNGQVGALDLPAVLFGARDRVRQADGGVFLLGAAVCANKTPAQNRAPDIAELRTIIKLIVKHGMLRKR